MTEGRAASIPGCGMPVVRRMWLGALVCALVGLAITMGVYPLIDPDEGRYASIGDRMASSGDWIVPRLNGLPYAEKPPAAYWAIALSIRLCGHSELAVRLPSALLTCLTAVWIAWLGARCWSSSAGVYAAMIYLSTPLVLFMSCSPLPDVPLAAGVSLALGVWLLESNGIRLRGASIVFAFGLSLAFLAKGPISFLLTLGPVAFCGREAWRRAARRVFAVQGGLFFLALVAPWFVEVSRRVPGFAWFFFWEEHVDRFLGVSNHAAHGLGPIDFVLSSVAVTLPWLPCAWSGVRCSDETSASRMQRRFLATWLLLPLCFFTLSSSRLLTYLLPGMPALALFAGRGLARAEAEAVTRRPTAVVFSLVAAGAVAIAAGLWAASPWFPPNGVSEKLTEMAGALGSLAWAVPVGLGAGLCIAGWLLARSAVVGNISLATVLCIAALASRLGAERLGAFFSTREIAKVLRDDAMVPAVNVGHLRQSLEFYSGRPIPQLGGPGELEFGGRFDDHKILLQEPEDLEKLAAGANWMYIIADAKKAQLIAAKLGRSIEEVAGAGNNLLFKLRAR